MRSAFFIAAIPSDTPIPPSRRHGAQSTSLFAAEGRDGRKSFFDVIAAIILLPQDGIEELGDADQAGDADTGGKVSRWREAEG
jgi:hypothetical protein